MGLSENKSLPMVYCAGPLFNQAEREEMASIADLLSDRGFGVYLPHRDGMEFRLVREELIQRGWGAEVAGAFLHSAIFALDIFQLVSECEALVWNMNGRVPDEGAVSEAAIAWTLGKPILAYKEDARSMIAGRDNPLLAGLVDFETISQLSRIPECLEEILCRRGLESRDLSELPQAVQKSVGQGSLLWSAMQEKKGAIDNAGLADVVTELFAPRTVG